MTMDERTGSTQPEETQTLLLGEREAARIIGISLVTLRKLRRLGEGPPHTRFTPQGNVYYRRVDIESWAAGLVEARARTHLMSRISGSEF